MDCSNIKSGLVQMTSSKGEEKKMCDLKFISIFQFTGMPNVYLLDIEKKGLGKVVHKIGT
jgi:hypothetical protein